MNTELQIKMTDAEIAMMNALSNNNSSTPRKSNPPTQKQLSAVYNLCEQKGVVVNKTRLLTFDDTSEYIQELMNMKNHVPASEKQIAKIKEYCDILGRSYPNFEHLEGGMNGTASQLIQKLKERVDAMPIPASEKQVEFIRQMQFCPDCEALTEADITALTKQSASEYISKYRAGYYTWVKNIISVDQMLNIVRLNCMIEGAEVSDVLDKIELTSAEKLQMLLPRQSLPYSGLLQITKEIAPEYINQLESELKSKIWQATTLEVEEMRGIKTIDDADEYTKIRTELRSICTLLYQAMGQELEEDWFETADFSAIKELVNEAILWDKQQVLAIFDNQTIFNSAQVEMLLAA